MNRLRRLIPSSDSGASLAAGLALLAIGFGLAWLPLAFIVPGALLVILPLLPSREVAE